METDNSCLPSKYDISSCIPLKKWLKNLIKYHNSKGALVYHLLDSINIWIPLMEVYDDGGRIRNFLRILPGDHFKHPASDKWNREILEIGGSDIPFEIAWHMYAKPDTSLVCMVLLYRESSKESLKKLNSVKRKFLFWGPVERYIDYKRFAQKNICIEIIEQIKKRFYKTLSYSQVFGLLLRRVKEEIKISNARLLCNGDLLPSGTVYSGWNSSESFHSEDTHKLFHKLTENGRFPILPYHDQGLLPKWAKNSVVFRYAVDSISMHWMLVKTGRTIWKSEEFYFLDQLIAHFIIFLNDILILNDTLNEYWIQSDIIRLQQDLSELLSTENFLIKAADILRSYLQVDSLALFVPTEKETALYCPRYSGLGPVSPVTKKRTEVTKDSFLFYSADTSKTIFKPEVKNEDRKKILDLKEVRSILYYPVKRDHGTLIILKIACKSPGALTFKHIQNIQFIENFLVKAYQNCAKFDHLLEGVYQDETTGLLNRRGFEEKLQNQLQQSKLQGKSFSVMMISIDRVERLFKNIQPGFKRSFLDNFSHFLKNAISKHGAVAYVKDFNFFALLSDADLEVALKFARNLCSQVCTKFWEATFRPTISIGVSSCPINGMDVDELMLSAEHAMTISRFQGGNTASIMGSAVLKKLALSIFSGLLGKEGFETGPEIVDGVLQKITSKEAVGELTVLEMINSLAEAIDAKDPYTSDHTLETSIYAVSLAKRMGLPEGVQERLRIAAKLHDIGKIGIPERILQKSGSLSREEENIMQKHPVIGAKILRPISSLKHIADIVEHHHEKWDGTGYPHCLRGEEIPIESRIISVIDAYHAIISDRPYRKGKSIEKALEEIKKGAGTQFDPYVVKVFIAFIEEKEGRKEERGEFEKSSDKDADSKYYM